MLPIRTASALVATVLLAACGGGSSSAKAPTKAAGELAAKSITLTSSDLPAGFKAEPHDSSNDKDPQEAAFAACVGASTPTDELVDLFSDDFSKGGQLDLQQVSSEVNIITSAAKAKKDLNAYQGSKTESCLKTFVTDLLKKQAGEGGGGVTFGPPSIARLDTSAGGTDGGFGYTVTTTASASGLQFPFEIAIQGFLLRHTAVSLTTLAVGKPFPAQVRSDLLAKLVQRTKDKAV